MNCSCGGETQVAETRIVDEIIRRRRKCKKCEYVFWTKEVFDREPIDKTKKAVVKQIYTKPEAAAIKQKKVDARRKVEDIKREKKLRVPSYFIEEEDY
jgi:transcriptional regulator NrdR family protein